jgi:hypothetical protein
VALIVYIHEQESYSSFELDAKGRIKVRYKNNRIEFLNADRCIARLDVSDEDHAL